MSNRIDVVSTVIMRDGKLLLARRAEGSSFAGYWETPGGKVEPGESPEQTVRRELREEMDVTTTSERMWDAAPPFDLDPPTVSKPLRMFFLTADIGDAEPRALASSEVRWCSRDEVASLLMTPATNAVRLHMLSLFAAA
jgi:8-oxo-dGTP diphosphatase